MLIKHIYQKFLLTALLGGFLLTPQLISQETKSFKNFLEESDFQLLGFGDHRSAYRTMDITGIDQGHFILNESKIQLESNFYLGLSEWIIKNDFLYDHYLQKVRLDLREANAQFYINKWLDLKVGRQILTWGKGDLVFINDLFPKDWQSFFIGREQNYLKAPSDAIRIDLSPKWVQLTYIYMPRFDADRFLTGERIVFPSPLGSGIFQSQNNLLPVDVPSDYFKESELAFKMHKSFGSASVDIYFYRGFWKSPSGFGSKEFIFPKLRVFGWSTEFNLLKGIFSHEGGFYISKEDTEGDNPLIRNSEIRFLIAYSRDFKKDLNISVQLYMEKMQEHDSYLSTLPSDFIPLKERIDQVSLRVTKRAIKQKLEISFFGFYSFSGNDFYLRPRIAYKLSDSLKFDIGANIFGAQSYNSFWGQFQDNTNVYIGINKNFTIYPQ